MATEPLARTSLSSIHNQKENRPKAAGVKDWDAIHAKVFNRFVIVILYFVIIIII